MPKDDYDVIAYKTLLYLYAVLKRKIVFDKDAFENLISKADISNEYLIDILRMMQSENLIEGASFKKAWGNDWILINDITEIRITADGVRYIKENATMKKIGTALSEVPGLVSSLISIVKPF